MPDAKASDRPFSRPAPPPEDTRLKQVSLSALAQGTPGGRSSQRHVAERAARECPQASVVGTCARPEHSPTAPWTLHSREAPASDSPDTGKETPPRPRRGPRELPHCGRVWARSQPQPRVLWLSSSAGSPHLAPRIRVRPPSATQRGSRSRAPGPRGVTHEAAFLAGLARSPLSSWRARGSLGTESRWHRRWAWWAGVLRARAARAAVLGRERSPSFFLSSGRSGCGVRRPADQCRGLPRRGAGARPPPREGARASAVAPRHRAKREPRAPGSCGPVTTVTATGRVPGARGQGRPGSEVLRTASWPHGPCSSGSGVHSDPGDLLPGTARCHPESPPRTTRPLPHPGDVGSSGKAWGARGS